MISTNKHHDPASTIDALSALPFWPALELQQRRALAEAGEFWELTSREPVRRSGVPGLLLVLTGCIRCYTSSENGKELTLFRLRNGEVCFPSPSSAACQLQALTDTRLLVIDYRTWEAAIQDCPAALRFSRDVIRQHMDAVLRAVELQFFSPVEKRVAELLLEQLPPEGHPPTIRLTHSEIALHLGTAREVISRTLEAFAHAGLLRIGRGRLTILDAAALRDIAAGTVTAI